MAIQMTRAEYEAKYGIAPILGAKDSSIDTTPAPAQMTKAEYIVRYGIDPFTKQPYKPVSLLGKVFEPAKESLQGLKTLYGGSEQGIASKLKADIEEGAKDIEEGKVVKGISKAGFRTAGDIASVIYAPIGALIGVTGMGKLTEKFGEWYVDKFGDDLTNNPIFQKFAIEHPNADEDFNRALILAMSAFESGKIEPKTAIPRTKMQVQGIKSDVIGGISKIKIWKIQRDIEKAVNEIGNIENNYAKLRKANQYSTDSGASSRERIAKSGVLNESTVDTTGTIRTKQKGGATEQYRKFTIDGVEDIVRKTLDKEGKTINLAEVSKALAKEISEGSGLEGADLKAAITGLTREMNGLKLRADNLGNIELVKIHDAKINTTKNINYQTPPETATYRKAVARVYKKLIEENSAEPIKAINQELGKYYGDIVRIESLDGLKVKGGKLGKYSARIAGNIAGGAVGSALGGWGGVALGTIIGGEVAAILKGRSMAKTFRGIKGEIPKSEILEQAKIKSELPITRIPLKSDTIKVSNKGESLLKKPSTKDTIKIGEKQPIQRKFTKTYLQEARKYKVATQKGITEVEGISVNINKDIKTFLHKDINGNWVVSEESTGMMLTEGGYSTQKHAIDDAKNFIDYFGIKNIIKEIEKQKGIVKPQVISKELQPLAIEARSMSEAEFISKNIFGKDIVGAEKKAIDTYAGKNLSDKLSSFYTQATKGIKEVKRK